MGKPDMAWIQSELKEKILRWTPKVGRSKTTIKDFIVVRRVNENEEVCLFDYPLIGITVQGFKHSTIGNDEYDYGEGHCLINGIDIPSISHINSATPGTPFLAVALLLDRNLVAKLSERVPVAPQAAMHNKPVAVTNVDPSILEAFLRLINLLDKPSEIPIMAPLIKQEIHHRLLLGPQGEWLRTICTRGTSTNQIAQAITWIRKNYMKTLRVDELARKVNMATSTFHRHFKEVTGSSPLQFQKQLRLHEAKRFILFDSYNVSMASFAVGYESPTQFCREYKRKFGAPPRDDIYKKRKFFKY